MMQFQIFNPSRHTHLFVSQPMYNFIKLVPCMVTHKHGFAVINLRNLQEGLAVSFQSFLPCLFATTFLCGWFNRIDEFCLLTRCIYFTSYSQFTCYIVELFFDTQNATNQCNRTRNITFLSVSSQIPDISLYLQPVQNESGL